MNRLKLDFSLDTAEERKAFCTQYLREITYTPTSAELETMGTYILWGKNQNGLNAQQDKSCVLKEWTQTQTPQSLEALIENPKFSESFVHPLTETPQKAPRIKLDRDQIRRTAPPFYLGLFEGLWRTIDTTELKTTLYELQAGKRTKPPRSELLERFTPAEIHTIETAAAKLSQHSYLKLRHRLVDLRREQYVLKDEYAPLRQPRGIRPYSEPATLKLGEEVVVRPLGLRQETPPALRKQVWTWPIGPNSDTDQAALSDFLWSQPPALDGLPVFDFRNTDHLWRAFKTLRDVPELKDETEGFVETLEWYATAADLKPIHRQIFEMKLQGKTNSEIQTEVNTTYGTSYNENYISTIWKKKILEEIAKVATLQEEELKEVFFEENWKRCTKCGRLLLKDPKYFMRKRVAPDGLGSRCKQCEKAIRDQRTKN